VKRTPKEEEEKKEERERKGKGGGGKKRDWKDMSLSFPSSVDGYAFRYFEV